MRRLIYAGLLATLLHAAASAQGLLPNPLPINGQVLDAEGRPVAGVLVFAAPADKGLRGVLPRVYTDASGKFTVGVRQTGLFVVGGSKPQEGYMRTANPFFGPSPDSQALVLVQENRPAPFATVRFRPKGGTLVLAVADAETNAPLTRVWLSLCRAEAPKYCIRLSPVNARGRFEVLVPPDPITVQVSAAGYKDWVAAGDGSQPPEVVRVDSGGTRELAVALRRPVQSVYAPAVPELETPLPLLPADGAELEPKSYPRRETVVWSPVPGASSYTVEVEFCMPGGVDGKRCVTPNPLEARFVQPQAGIEGTSYTFTFPGSQPGRWRVWAVDSAGRPGAKSAWFNFTYRL
jgi:hypothetical protein